MPKDIRLAIRLVALWIIFVGSLWFLFYPAQQLIVAVVKTLNGGYENFYSGSYYSGNYCLQQPVYPQLSNGMTLSKEDTAATEKYNSEQKAYNAKVAEECTMEQKKQQESQDRQEQSSSLGDITSNALASFLAIAAAFASMAAIKKGESA